MKYIKKFENYEEAPDWAKGKSLDDMINDPSLTPKFLAAVYKGKFYNSKGLIIFVLGSLNLLMCFMVNFLISSTDRLS